MTDVKFYTAQETLKDGQSVTIRAIQSGDRQDFLQAIKELDEHTIYMRFFQANKKFTDKEVSQAVEVDFDKIVALVTCIRNNDEEKIIGGGRYMTYGNAHPHDKAEVAFTVRNGYHSLGMAGMMLKHLALIAKDRGIKEFHAEVLSANKGMLNVFRKSGFPLLLEVESDVTHVMLKIGD